MRQLYQVSILFFSIMLVFTGRAQTPSFFSEKGEVAQGDTAIFRFAPGRQMFWYDYQGNAESIRMMSQLIRTYKPSIESGNIKVRVLGFCSSYGSVKENLMVAKDRSNQVKSYFIVHEGLKEQHFRTTNSTRRWQGLKDVIAVAYLWESGRSSGEPPTLPSPSADLSEEQPLVVSDSPTPNDRSVEAVPEITQQDQANSSAASSVSGQTAPHSLEIDPVVEQDHSYRWAIKTNVAYLAATVANLGVEFGVSPHFSIDLPVLYSPYTIARDYRLRLLVIQPELRYWLREPMHGHFFGVHLNMGAFNISVDSKNRYQSPDGFYGIGLSYGYTLPLSRHWAAEFSLGAGYVHTKYDVYYNIPNGARYEKGQSYNYWGLTKVGIGLMYRFGK